MSLLLRKDFESLIPHAGLMCLWDEVLSHDDSSIHCRTRSHLSVENPLRADGRLSAVHLIEYGAQTMAIHGGLQARSSSGGTVQAGVLAAVREAKLAVEHLDDLGAAIECQAKRMVVNPGGAMYEFVLSCAGREIARGRASVIYLPG